ncbi:hypothetical protein [Nostoc sp.]|uniref:hypothetical protein n=1 Tax=Nostoc sp. TaxID=1180 RepID=UPI002FFA4BAE
MLELRKIVGWVKQSATQQSPADVGFRSSTQPTLKVFGANPSVLSDRYQYLLLTACEPPRRKADGASQFIGNSL